MTRGEYINGLIAYAREYVNIAITSVYVNKHMNELKDIIEDQKMVDALIVDFINFIGMKQCMDLGLYTKDLRKDRKGEE